ncbi:DUF2254 domain-containing protein [Aldersonia sp. NBC_00410]|uniref:DUF2254 domain-containing protein n=1 Tax=Aldersonia sp. NBC_00410 TaxID=2975954 RepID=UPI002252D8AD|nr:DUF2254 domain-containing protein [Aldersonia sp. NBC_00410]MCX5044125.1 DUF2254 domain-containing protein [Aldersonia sp. NBC_00410]
MNRRRGERFREYLSGALWVWPSVAVVLAIALGSGLSRVTISESSRFHWLVFQGTADDARTLLIGIAGTTITVIALMLGLTVVALQLSSTQYSPRIVRNFLRDRPNQVVLSVFVATFAYSAAGLYTVGVYEGDRSAGFPRAAVSGAIALLFLTLGALVYEVHHISHAMQVDEIMRQIEQHTVAVIDARLPGGDDDGGASPSAGAVAVPAPKSGYLQTLYPESAVRYAETHSVHVLYTRRVGQHIVAGAPLAWVWTGTDTSVDSERCTGPVAECVRIGFERTMEQDAAFGLRQLVDIAAKALSPAVNDPYTAVQAIDHLSTVLAALAPHPLGPAVIRPSAAASVTIPARDFASYLDLACGQIRRFGASEPTIAQALIEMLTTATNALAADADGRRASIGNELDLVLADAQRCIAQRADLTPVQHDGSALRALLANRR